MTEEQFRERAVDYLYDELAPDERARFEAHLASSERARRELAALRDTLTIARAALRVESAPPAHVRATVLAAAQAAVGAHEPRGRVVTLLKRPWLYPALGVAAALAIVLLKRDEVERGEIALRAPAPAAQTAPSEAPAPASPESAATDDSEASSVRADRPAPSQPGEPPPQKRAARSTRPGAAARARELARAPRYAEPPADHAFERSEGEAAAEPQAGARAEHKGAPPAASPAASSYAAPAATGLGSAAGEGTSASAGKPRAKSSAARDESRSPDDANALERRARMHVEAGRLVEARATYRELLRRFPDDRRADGWRRALAQLERDR